MNQLEALLELTLQGYSPDAVGCLAYLLNKHIKITESKIRTILNIPITEAGRAPQLNVKEVLSKTVASLKTKNKQRPLFKDIETELITLFGKVIPQDKLAELAKHISDAWDEYELIADFPTETEDPTQQFQRLAEVPTKGEQEWQKYSQEFHALPMPRIQRPSQMKRVNQAFPQQP